METQECAGSPRPPTAIRRPSSSRCWGSSPSSIRARAMISCRPFASRWSHYWHAHPGQIYPTLERMERDGWIAGREVIQRGRPNKRVYSITAEGRRVLLEWLAQSLRAVQDEESAAAQKPLPRASRRRRRAREVCRRCAMRWPPTSKCCAATIAKSPSMGGAYQDVNEMFVYFTLRRGIEFARSEVEFCEWAMGEIDEHRELFR